MKNCTFLKKTFKIAPNLVTLLYSRDSIKRLLCENIALTESLIHAQKNRQYTLVVGKEPEWPDRAIYCNLANFSKPVAQLFCPNCFYLGKLLKVSKSFIFLVTSVLGYFYRRLATGHALKNISWFPWRFSLSKKWADPGLFFRLFSSVQTHYKFYSKYVCEKCPSNRYTVPGFELTTFGPWVSSHNH